MQLNSIISKKVNEMVYKGQFQKQMTKNVIEIESFKVRLYDGWKNHIIENQILKQHSINIKSKLFSLNFLTQVKIGIDLY